MNPLTEDVASFELVLEDGDAAELAWMARELCASGPGEVDDPRWIARVRDAAEELPAAVRRAMRRYRRGSGPDGTFLFRGLPVEEAELPPTPTVPESVQRSVSPPAAMLMLFACALGEPVAFRAEKAGALVQDVVPVPGQEEFQGNAGSVLLAFHNENAFHENRPDHLMLLCLRPDHERAAGLLTASVRRLLPRLSAGTVEALSSPEFVTVPPPSFGAAGGVSTEHAVLSGAAEDPDIRLDFGATIAVSARAEAALTELRRAMSGGTTVTRLTTGDLAIVDNRAALHGRTAFRPRYDGSDRWLQRTFVASDLRRSRGLRPHDGQVLTH